MLRQSLLALCVLITAQQAVAAEAGKIIFVAGKASLDERPATLSAPVQEGELLSTGPDGYLYIKTIDDGLFILRPSTKARITAYHVDRDNPANTRIKLELISGVARSQSGQAVKLARQNFRFNTPVAAIGVRGTDFAVSADHDTTRVTVLSGGITISGFAGACRPEGSGPCEGAASRDLSSAQRGLLLQIQRGQSAAQLLPATTLAPDVVSPPRIDEPGGKPAVGGGGGGGGTALNAVDPSLDTKKNTIVQNQVSLLQASLNQDAIKGNNPPPSTPSTPADPLPPVVVTPPVTVPEQPVVVTPPVVTPPEVTPPVVTPPVVTPPVVVPPVVETPPVVTPPVVEVPPVKPVDPVVVVPANPSKIIWGRWLPLLDKPAVVDMVAESGRSEMITQKSEFALFRSKGDPYVTPERGTVSFAMQQSEAYIYNDSPFIKTVAAQVQNGALKFDFDKKSFATSFDLVSAGETFKLQSQGQVGPDGRFYGENQFSRPTNVNVDGVLSSENGGSAAYLFQGRLDSKRSTAGAIYWGAGK